MRKMYVWSWLAMPCMANALLACSNIPQATPLPAAGAGSPPAGQTSNKAIGAGESRVATAVGAVDDNSLPPSAGIGASVPDTYFGPHPSEIQKELIGPYQLLKAGKIDVAAGTITLPLYLGHMKDGTNVWYVLTDTDDKPNAEALGLDFSAKLTYAGVGKAARAATMMTDGSLMFDVGKVDFAPERSITAGDGPNAFPPKQAQPGSVGDADYSPLIHITNAGNHIYNAPIIAFGVNASQITFPNGNVDHKVLHDHVTKIDPVAMLVTLKMNTGFSFSRPVFYLSFDANDPVVATLEESTLAPGMSDLHVGGDDGAFSAVERLFTFTNGPTGKLNPQRQGLSSAIVDGGGPLNVLGGVPTVATDYSPMWDVNVAEWTPDAIKNGYRSRLDQEFQVLGMVKNGWLTGPGGKEFGSSGSIVNCPIAMRLL